MKKTFAIRVISPLLLLAFATLACNLPAQPLATPDLGLIVAQTQTAMAVNQFLTAATPPQSPAPTHTPGQSPSPTSTQPTGTQPVIIQPTSTPPSVVQVTPIGPGVTQPAPSATAQVQSSCANAAKFLNETVPDDSIFASDQQFMKTWTLQNVGTCTWSPDYALVYVNGDQMTGTSPAPIGQSVPPGGAIQIYLPQTAPHVAGNYQGYWKLRSPNGQDFGLGANGATPFWVKISVVPGSSSGGSGGPFTGPRALGAPTWVESFNSKNGPWYLGTDSGIDYGIKNGQLIITAGGPTGDQWRVAQPGFLDDFYLQGNFKSGAACSGKDGYGLLVRAPNRPNGVINSGYVFGFSCDGKYRVYRLDSGNFTAIQNWANNPVVKPGPNQSNVMGVYAKGDHFQLYANGALIFEFTDSAYSGGLFGLMIRSEATNNYQVFVDEISAWVLP